MAEFKELEQKLSKYKFYLRESKIIELSIRFPTKPNEHDVGIRGNIPNNDSMLQTLIKIEDDEKLNEYRKIGAAIEETYANVEEHLQKCMKVFYFDRTGPFRGHVRATSAKLNVDPKTLWNWRIEITNEFKKNLDERFPTIPDNEGKSVIK